MRKRAEDAGFKVGHYYISAGLANLIKSQIQYYFSLPNLITDHFLKNIINSSKGGWVKIELFLSFKMVQQIFMNHLGSRLSRGQQRTIVMKSCSCSQILQVDFYTIKRKNAPVLVKDFSSLLYIEGIQMQQAMQILGQKQISKEMINVSQGKQWFFIEIKNKNMEEMQKIIEHFFLKLKDRKGIRILPANQFISLQKQYVELINLKPIESANLQTFPILSYRQIEEFRQLAKRKPIKPKGKNKGNRLPRFLIEPNSIFGKKGRYWYDKERLKIDVEGCQPRVVVKTPEQALAYRRQKIQARRQRKQERANRRKQMQNERMEQEGEVEKMVDVGEKSVP